MTDISTWLDSILSFPQLSFLKPIILSVVVLIAVDLCYKFIFSFFRRFFE